MLESLHGRQGRWSPLNRKSWRIQVVANVHAHRPDGCAIAKPCAQRMRHVTEFASRRSGRRRSRRKNAGGGLSTTIKEPTYGKIIYSSSVSPFKFAVEPAWSVSGAPFILNAKEVLTPYYKPLNLSYSNMPAGSERALIGTAKNISPFDLRNVTILASVHNANGTQIDSVKSRLFPEIRPGQIVAFAALPDPAIKAHIAYFSCADIAIGNNPTTSTLGIGNGQFISYQMYGVVEISALRYDNATDSLLFGIKHFNPAGGNFSLKLPELSNNPVSVTMDGKLTSASVKMDGKTVNVDFFVPPSNHQVQIKGIRNVT